MTDTPKWQTKPYKITGWICIGFVLLVGGTDAVLAILKQPTISQYVTARDSDQPLFGWIVLGVMIYLILHWFWKKFFGKK